MIIMLKKKKPINHEDVTGEEIRKHINRHKMLNSHVEVHMISKSITFIMLFFIWLFFTVVVESIQIRYFLLIVGLPLLIVIFQAYISNPTKNFHDRHHR